MCYPNDVKYLNAARLGSRRFFINIFVQRLGALGASGSGEPPLRAGCVRFGICDTNVVVLGVNMVGFLVVEFINERGGDGVPVIEVVPSSWIDERQQSCPFPPTGSNQSSLIRKAVQPSENWDAHTVRVLPNGMAGKDKWS